ncbi:hypothetical protein MBAV_002466 [Candidatus Magnetobacterium bavaricum]|uniref:Uncharacterized protein n=1 Tax=Candidatus Magnetobacterium bavaricum TaxID=29290 RepID=A0A0F3GTU0_9BACT|nr:hypothetical protein MBAV_002466 [Candidatus Magnetobacterium bavaricum]
MTDVLNPRVLFEGLPVIRWLLYALFLLNLPVPVFLNLFSAPLWVFSFGNVSS